uniref:hypothetical protein n=1 Tax=Staphylococcus aureus TaxID=1280 RepID=UPI0038B235A2
EHLIQLKREMSSLKAVKPVGIQAPIGQQDKKEPAAPKASVTTPKAPPAQASKAAPKKAETKPREPRKRTTISKPSAKN